MTRLIMHAQSWRCILRMNSIVQKESDKQVQITSWEQPTPSKNSTAVQVQPLDEDIAAPPTMTRMMKPIVVLFRFDNPKMADIFYDHIETVIQSSKSFLSSSNAALVAAPTINNKNTSLSNLGTSSGSGSSSSSGNLFANLQLKACSTPFCLCGSGWKSYLQSPQKTMEKNRWKHLSCDLHKSIFWIIYTIIFSIIYHILTHSPLYFSSGGTYCCLHAVGGCKILSVKEENGFEDEDVFLLCHWDLQWVHSISSNENNPFSPALIDYANRIVINQKLWYHYTNKEKEQKKQILIRRILSMQYLVMLTPCGNAANAV